MYLCVCMYERGEWKDREREDKLNGLDEFHCISSFMYVSCVSSDHPIIRSSDHPVGACLIQVKFQIVASHPCFVANRLLQALSHARAMQQTANQANGYIITFFNEKIDLL